MPAPRELAPARILVVEREDQGGQLVGPGEELLASALRKVPRAGQK
jgi:hypothetical protein